MSRPAPTILMSTKLPNNILMEVCAGDATYAVVYDGNAINVRTYYPIRNAKGDQTPFMSDVRKYSRTSFANPGHAFNLAEKLNGHFCTDKFTVEMLYNGHTITETMDIDA